jgi:hypothetical protein
MLMHSGRWNGSPAGEGVQRVMIKAHVLVKQLQIEPVDRLPSYSNAPVLYSRGGLCGADPEAPQFGCSLPEQDS